MFAMLAAILPIIMISLSLGYLVCAQARQQSKFLKILGYILGFVVIVGSLVMVAGSIQFAIKANKARKDPRLQQQKFFEQMMKSGKMPKRSPMETPKEKRKE